MSEPPNTVPGSRPAESSREIELVLLLCRPRIDAVANDRIGTLLHAPLDWDRLRGFAWKHRLLPLVSQRLSLLDPASVPVAAREEFQRSARSVSQHNLLLSGELARILRAFDERRISILPFKGPSLALTLYGNLAVRPFSDLDLLVRGEDVVAAQEILTALGYTPKLDLTDAQQAAFLHYENDRTFLHGANGVAVELHWRFFARYVAFDIGGRSLWGRLRKIPFAGVEMATLPPEEYLLVLALHGTKHLWALAGWVLDIAQLVAVYDDLDWSRLEELASATGGERMLHLALKLASDLFGAPLPHGVASRIAADPVAARLAGQVEDSLGATAHEAISEIEEHRFYLGSRERLRDRLLYYWLWLFTPNYKDQSFIRLPAPLTPLYYLIRPVRMTIDLLRRERG
jgi:hypothetical protein